MNDLTTTLSYLTKTIMELDPSLELDELMLRALFEDTVLAKAEDMNINLDQLDENSNWPQIEFFLQENIDNYSAFLQSCADEFVQEYKNSMQEE
jgi:uncharacterized protein YlxW (UPF0749 family)